MEFEKSRTWANLMSAFAGESQARTKYENYARKASEQGYEQIAAIFRATAANELAHAEQFLEKLQQHGKQPIENIDVAAGYPFTHGVTMENLYEAAHSEEQEFLDVYPAIDAAARGRVPGRCGALGADREDRGAAPRRVPRGVQPDADRHTLQKGKAHRLALCELRPYRAGRGGMEGLPGV